MLDETKHMGLPAPQFREMGECIVTFQKHPALLSALPPVPRTEETLWEEEDQAEIPVQNRQSEQRLTRAIEYVHQHGVITNAMERKLTGVSDRTASRDLEL
jgi:predicted HTH transcriptional regulator